MVVDRLDNKLFGAKLAKVDERMKQVSKEAEAAKAGGERPKKRIQIVR